MPITHADLLPALPFFRRIRLVRERLSFYVTVGPNNPQTPFGFIATLPTVSSELASEIPNLELIDKLALLYHQHAAYTAQASSNNLSPSMLTFLRRRIETAETDLQPVLASLPDMSIDQMITWYSKCLDDVEQAFLTWRANNP